MFFLSPLQAEKFLPNAYNLFAGEFSETRNTKWKEFEDLTKNDYQRKTDIKILDIGCGNGRLRKFLAEKKFEGEYFARDIADNFFSYAKKNLKEFDEKKIHFSKGGFLDLCNNKKNGFPKNFFDEVWAIASFHHLSQHKEREIALNNIYNILKQDGEIIITVWNIWEQEKYIQQKKKAFWRSIYNPFFSYRDFLIPWGKDKIPRYYYSFSKEYLLELLLNAGFTIQKVFYSDKKRNLCIKAQKTKNSYKKFFVKNIPFTITSEKNVLEILNNFTKNTQNSFHKIYTPNPEMVVETQNNKNFFEILQKSNISLPDGNGIIWASGLYKISYTKDKFGLWKFFIKLYSLIKYIFMRKRYLSPIKKTICGSDIFQKFLEKTKNSSKIKIFLLGGAKGSAKYIKKKYPQICGIFDEEVNENTHSKIIQTILDSQANVLFVALGAPKQELIIEKFSKNQKISQQISFAMGVGGSFDFVSGYQKRAPKIIRNFGFEWLYRLIKYPERKKRIWNATWNFINLF